MASNVLAELDKEAPPDWQDTMPRALHTAPFKWKRREPVLPVWRELQKEAPNPIALIAQRQPMPQKVCGRRAPSTQ